MHAYIVSKIKVSTFQVVDVSDFIPAVYSHWPLVSILVVPANDTQELEQGRGVAGNAKVGP